MMADAMVRRGIATTVSFRIRLIGITVVLRTAAREQLRRRYGVDSRAVPRAVRVYGASEVGTLGVRAAPHLTILRDTGPYSRCSNRSWEILSARRNESSPIRVWKPVRQLRPSTRGETCRR